MAVEGKKVYYQDMWTQIKEVHCWLSLLNSVSQWLVPTTYYTEHKGVF